MLLYSTPTSKILPHHDKAYHFFMKWMNYVPKEMKNLKVFVAGSYAMNSLFSPSSPWSDHDYYFLDTKSLDSALNIITQDPNVTIVCQTDNAYTFKYKNSLSFQFVKLIYENPYQILSSFDFTACSVAFDFKGNIYFTPSTVYSWKKNLLDFNNFDTWSSSSDTSQKTVNLLSRINKYKTRYNFSLSENALLLLANHINKNKDNLNLKLVSKNSSGLVEKVISLPTFSLPFSNQETILETLRRI